jgi:ribosome-binding ATPase YchF (GTP1/OBG family)
MFKAIFGKKQQQMINEAKPFVKFDGTKLRLEPLDGIPNLESVKVLSILGKARMGKSTFLNAIVSKLQEMDVKVFNCQTGIEHCTIGVDYYFIPDHNLLLLDSQGLANGDAQHDPALLLFIYLISDVIIFNDSKILQNEALKLIEPICAFMTYIEDMDKKPHLVFRLSDGKLVKDTKKNLENVLAPHEDQYQSIRNSIVELFEDPIQLVKTETLDRAEENLMDNNSYLDLLAIQENGFDRTISHILELLDTTKPKPNILQNLPKIVDMINTNSKITIDKLDVVGLLATNEVMSWVNDIDPALYSPLNVDGSQAMYDSNVEPRIAEVKKKITAFKRRFNKVSPTVKNKHLQTLEQKLQEPIRNAKLQSEQKAEQIVSYAVATYVNKNYQLPELDTTCSSVTHIKDEHIKNIYLSSFTNVLTACKSVYEPVRTKYTNLATAAEDEFLRVVKVCRALEDNELTEVTHYFDAFVTDFKDWIDPKIESLVMRRCMSRQTNAEITDIWLQELITDTQDFIKKTVNCRTISSNFTEQKLTCSIYGNGKTVTVTYDLIAQQYNDFVKDVTALMKSTTIEAAINESKERMLEDRLFFDVSQANELRLNNPNIEFVYDSVLLDCMVMSNPQHQGSQTPYMTKRTWDSIYVPFYKLAMKALALKGVVNQNDTYDKYIISVKEANAYKIQRTEAAKTDFYDKNVCDLILNQMKEIYCKKRVEGFEFPTCY